VFFWTEKNLRLPLQVKFKVQDGLDDSGLRRQTGSILLMKFQQELPALMEMYDAKYLNAKEEEDDVDLKFSKLQERLYGIGSWYGLMVLLEEFAEPFILDLARKRDDSSLYAEPASRRWNRKDCFVVCVLF